MVADPTHHNRLCDIGAGKAGIGSVVLASGDNWPHTTPKGTVCQYQVRSIRANLCPRLLTRPSSEHAAGPSLVSGANRWNVSRQTMSNTMQRYQARSRR